MELSVGNLEFAYSKKEVLQDINLELNLSHKIVSLIGPNGSGKSTLVRLLTRHLPLAKGEIRLNKQELGDYSHEEFSRMCASIEQQSSITLPYTVWEMLLFGRYPYRRSSFSDTLSTKEHEILEKTAAETEIGHLLTRSVLELSGGELQRVFFAKALVQDADILFIDEPFSQMDVYYQFLCLNILKKKVKNEGKCVLAVLHDLQLVDAYSDEVILLDAGACVAAGSVKDVMLPDILEPVFRVSFSRDSGGNMRISSNG